LSSSSVSSSYSGNQFRLGTGARAGGSSPREGSRHPIGGGAGRSTDKSLEGVSSERSSDGGIGMAHLQGSARASNILPPRPGIEESDHDDHRRARDGPPARPQPGDLLPAAL